MMKFSLLHFLLFIFSLLTTTQPRLWGSTGAIKHLSSHSNVTRDGLDHRALDANPHKNSYSQLKNKYRDRPHIDTINNRILYKDLNDEKHEHAKVLNHLKIQYRNTSNIDNTSDKIQYKSIDREKKSGVVSEHDHSVSRRSVDSSEYEYSFLPRESRGEGEWEGVRENCSECETMREMKKTYRLSMIKDEILRKLRLSSPPNVSGVARAPSLPLIERLIAQYNEDWSPQDEGVSDGGWEDDYHATPRSAIIFSEQAPVDLGSNDSTICWFPLHQQVFNHEVIDATLNIYIRNTQQHLNNHFSTYLLVHRLGAQNQEEGGPSRRMIHVRRIRLGEGGVGGGWVEVEFKGVLGRLLGKKGVYGIQIEAYDERGEQLAVVRPQAQHEIFYRPYLEIHVRERGSSRAKRNPERLCEEQGAERTCCRYPLVVDFKEFGWDFVIVPQRYSAYYCSGDCPYMYMRMGAHSYLTQGARRNGGGPCCTPRKVSQISMIYYDENMNIVYSKLPGMTVDSCGCN